MSSSQSGDHDSFQRSVERSHCLCVRGCWTRNVDTLDVLSPTVEVRLIAVSRALGLCDSSGYLTDIRFQPSSASERLTAAIRLSLLSGRFVQEPALSHSQHETTSRTPASRLFLSATVDGSPLLSPQIQPLH